MVIAGIKLLKGRRNGLKWSNGYAWASLSAKAINLILAVTVVLPAMTAMTDDLMRDSGVPAGAENVLSGAMLGGMIGSVLISCVYPVLTLVLLNRPATKAWFASRPR